VRIPLDFYRILGVPIQAIPEQIQQAYSDRLQQLPHYQHSSAAISARKQLLEEACTVLCDPEQRQEYDQKFLSQTYALDQPNQNQPNQNQPNQTQADPKAPEDGDRLADEPGLEVQDALIAGVLLLLHELGEYELVLKVGKPYVSRGILDLKRPYTGSALLEADIVLTLALAHLELGRQHVRQCHYVKAAYELMEGLDMLTREGLFSEVQSQIRADLYQLRPYRILELVALPLSEGSARNQGLSLLSEMLTERRGMDGTGNDQSGLSVEDFLKFIYQIRSYLTVAEQQELFEVESRRPSAAGTYLAIYALMANGFAQRQPALIRRAKVMLRRLNIHQDVFLEQASCTLLLGQTREALQALDQSHDYEALAFIREQSIDSPDLIPGIYRYTERWLQEEVFPHFRDLIDQPVRIQDYFADEQVQTYLEAMEADPTQFPLEPATPLADGSTMPGSLEKADLPPTAEPATQVPTRKQSLLDSPWDLPPLAQPVQVPPTRSFAVLPGGKNGYALDPAPLTLTEANRAEPEPTRTRRKPRPLPNSVYQRRLGLLLVVGGFSLIGMVAIAYYLWRQFQPPAPAPVTASAPVVAPNSPSPLPTTPVPPFNEEAAGDTSKLTPDQAKQVIQTWQQLKAGAMGKAYAVEDLKQVLAEPVLSSWQSAAAAGQAEQTYWQYQLNDLQVESVKNTSPDRTEVVAKVSETANFYGQDGQPQADQSYTDRYRVQYTLVRQGNQWLIKNMKVLR
jgi:curved DNA-binding protein CbpA